MGLASTFIQILLFGVISFECMAGSAPIPKVVFRDIVSSTGWIGFDFQDGKRIYSGKINGYEAAIFFGTGIPVPKIDKAFAAFIGLPLKGDSTSQLVAGNNAAESIAGLQIQIGNLILPDINVAIVDFFPAREKYIPSTTVLYEAQNLLSN